MGAPRNWNRRVRGTGEVGLFRTWGWLWWKHTASILSCSEYLRCVRFMKMFVGKHMYQAHVISCTRGVNCTHSTPFGIHLSIANLTRPVRCTHGLHYMRHVHRVGNNIDDFMCDGLDTCQERFGQRGQNLVVLSSLQIYHKVLTWAIACVLRMPVLHGLWQ